MIRMQALAARRSTTRMPYGSFWSSLFAPAPTVDARAVAALWESLRSPTDVGYGDAARAAERGKALGMGRRTAKAAATPYARAMTATLAGIRHLVGDEAATVTPDVHLFLPDVVPAHARRVASVVQGPFGVAPGARISHWIEASNVERNEAAPRSLEGFVDAVLARLARGLDEQRAALGELVAAAQTPPKGAATGSRATKAIVNCSFGVDVDAEIDRLLWSMPRSEVDLLLDAHPLEELRARVRAARDAPIPVVPELARSQRSVEQAVAKAREAGVFIVAALGNGVRASELARLAGVVGVGATKLIDGEEVRADSVVEGRDLQALGEGIPCEGSDELLGGTSFAAPLVVGVALWCATIDPAATPDDIAAILVDSSRRLEGDDAPTLNALAAVELALALARRRTA